MKKILIRNAFLHALGAAAYVALVASGIFYSSHLIAPGPDRSILIPMTMLLLLVLSAAMMGTLIFGRPVMLYLDGKKKEALSFLFYTLGFFSLLTALSLTTLFLESKKIQPSLETGNSDGSYESDSDSYVPVTSVKTYTDTQYGFMFDYPSDAKVVPENGGGYISAQLSLEVLAAGEKSNWDTVLVRVYTKKDTPDLFAAMKEGYHEGVYVLKSSDYLIQVNGPSGSLIFNTIKETIKI